MQNPQSDYKTILEELKQEQIAKIKQRHTDKILEKENAEFLITLIQNAESKEAVLKLSALGMSLKRTGFHFDVRLEKSDRAIKYFVKNESLSFEPLGEADSKAESTKENDSKILDEKLAFSSDCARSYLESNEAQSCRIADLSLKAESQKITHTLIIGDNYPALLNLLIEYRKKIKVIYIDPPYGKDDLGEFAQTNYDNAITRDNLLSMLYPRLSLAKMLLQDDGVIFCSIDDKNQAYVKGLFDEVFGEGNFVANFIWHSKNKPSGNTQLEQNIDTRTEYILCYQKNILNVNRYENTEKELREKGYILKDEYFETRGHYKLTPLMHSCSASSFQYLESLDYEIQAPDGTMFKNHQNVKKPKSYCYTWSKNLFDFGFANGFIEFTKTSEGEWVANRKMYEFCAIDNKKLEIVYRKSGVAYHNLITEKLIENLYSDSGANEVRNILNEKIFANPKPVNLIKHLLKISTTNPSDYVDLQVDSMDYDNAATTGGGGELSPHSLESKNLSLRGGGKATNEAIHNTESKKADSSDMDSSVDCHDFANAKSRNDDKAESISQSDSKILQEKEEGKAEAVEMINCGFQGGGEGSYLSGSNRADTAESAIYRSNATPEIILDFFAGSGTTAHAIMQLNREDGGNRKCILVTNNETTELNPNGIAKDVTTKRLKRIMAGSCYDSETNFKWREKNEPYGDGLEVLEIESISDTDSNIFDKIDERLYGKDFTSSKQDKIKWVCENFEATCKSLESNDTDSMDCHDCTTAESRNELDSTKRGE